MVEDSEALAQRRGKHSGPRGGPDQREGAERDSHGAGVESLVHDEVDREVLHGRVEQLLDDSREPVDLVDEQHVALAQIRQDAHQIGAPLERRTRRGHDRGAHLIGQDGGERRLAEAGRPGEQHVVQRLSPLSRRLHRDAQAPDRGVLAHILVEPLRAELPFDLHLFGEDEAAHDAGFIGHRFWPR
jgi:hypothetical protein